MEMHKEKIVRFSKVIYILLKVMFVAYIVAGALGALCYLWSILSLQTEAVWIAGQMVEAPLLFKLGDVKVYLPMMWESGFDLAVHADPIVDFSDLLRTALTVVGLKYALSVFMLLREDGSPFREGIVKAMKNLALALLLVGAVSGIIPLVAAGIVWVLCLIFTYGCALQNESDTTL